MPPLSNTDAGTKLILSPTIRGALRPGWIFKYLPMQLSPTFFLEIKQIFQVARQKTFSLVNRAMINAYWEIGRRILEEEQKGQDRAQYGAFLLRELAVRLTEEFGKGFDERELRRMRQFYQYFPLRDALRPELTWTHYRLILRQDTPEARAYYIKEAAEQSWGTRQLERNIQSKYYERLLSTQGHPRTLPGEDQPGNLSAGDLLKDPYVLEFLGMDIPSSFSESDLESAILGNLQRVLLELGRGFAFVGRQYSIKTETKQFYIDLVFYNFILKTFILIDLKISELTHQDIGQMDMYVRMWEDLKKVPGDNPTIGIILCAEKDATLVKYSVLEENKQLFASSYRLVLPTEEEWKRELQKSQQSFLDPSADPNQKTSVQLEKKNPDSIPPYKHVGEIPYCAVISAISRFE